MGPTTLSTTGHFMCASMGTPPGKVSRRASLLCWASLLHPNSHFPEGRGLTDLMAPTALAWSWPLSLSNRAAPLPRSCNTTGYSTKAGVRVPCWMRRLCEASSAVNLLFAACLLLGWFDPFGGGTFRFFFSPPGGGGGGTCITHFFFFLTVVRFLRAVDQGEQA